jgi:hypothetical protein
MYSILVAILLPVLAIGVLVFFFISIYMGSYYLQEHLQVCCPRGCPCQRFTISTVTLQDESPNGLYNKIGLPNTHNMIQKWSITNLHGVDLTKLGPPPHVSVYCVCFQCV